MCERRKTNELVKMSSKLRRCSKELLRGASLQSHLPGSSWDACAVAQKVWTLSEECSPLASYHMGHVHMHSVPTQTERNLAHFFSNTILASQQAPIPVLTTYRPHISLGGGSAVRNKLSLRGARCVVRSLSLACRQPSSLGAK